MKFNCPACGEPLSLAALLEHDAAREAVLLALQFPAPLGKLLIQYVSLFKPAQRALSMDRFANIMSEMLPMINAAQIERNGRIWPAPMTYWQQALEIMLTSREKLTLPIKSHGYLLSIIAGFAEKSDAKAERQTEQGRKYGEIKTSDHGVDANKMILKKSEKREAKVNLRDTLTKMTGKA